jgi:hypothetical protein
LEAVLAFVEGADTGSGTIDAAGSVSPSTSSMASSISSSAALSSSITNKETKQSAHTAVSMSLPVTHLWSTIKCFFFGCNWSESKQGCVALGCATRKKTEIKNVARSMGVGGEKLRPSKGEGGKEKNFLL